MDIWPLPTEDAGEMESLQDLLREKFGFDGFRPSQEAVCQAVVDGKDVLLVMPTGAGKSLCYQVPGLARGGTTLVISPLLALIDDQVAKLTSRGLRAKAIHSGIDREVSRETCRQYLRGEVDYLFIAPERLGVPGFLELLAKRKPSLIAIDEAHCISQWGHDFRPDYRKLGERLQYLRPAPIIAMTATATPVVQDDIVEQLAIPKAQRFIQGFRRTNIAIQAFEVPRSNRSDVCAKILKDTTRVPAIIYAPTRKIAEEIAGELKKKKFKSDCYHAGMTGDDRERVQTDFLAGKLQIIVATVAFGMGIDKADVRTVIHAGLSGSVEAYYQEIGRAGRDGKPSQAILLYSYSDQKTHEFFFDKDYPEVQTLEKVHAHALKNPVCKRDLANRLSNIEPEALDKAIEKLWALGAVSVDAEETVEGRNVSWLKSYSQQRSYRQDALRRMVSFAEASSCRMVYFLKHFGDLADHKGACEICDSCGVTPDQKLLQDSRGLSSGEQDRAVSMLAALTEKGMAVGKLFEEVTRDHSKMRRGEFETLLKSLVAADWLRIEEESFEKTEGRETKTITYRKVYLTAQGANGARADLAAVQKHEMNFEKKSSRSPRTSRANPKKKRSKVRKRSEARAWGSILLLALCLAGPLAFGDEKIPADSPSPQPSHGWKKRAESSRGADTREAGRSSGG